MSLMVSSDESVCSAANANALAVATAKGFSSPTLAPAWVKAYAAAIAESGCPAVQPALARELLCFSAYPSYMIPGSADTCPMLKAPDNLQPCWWEANLIPVALLVIMTVGASEQCAGHMERQRLWRSPIGMGQEV